MESLRGIIPPIVTPLHKDETLDIEGLEKLLDHVIKGGVHGIFILGTTGEGASFSPDQKVEMIKRTLQLANGRVPVLVNISDTSYQISLKLAEKSKAYGAHAVVATPPFYLKINESEIISYYNQLIKGVSLPLYLYNNPGLTKLNLDPDILQPLLKDPKVLGIKDSSGDAKYFNRVRRLKELTKFSLFMGPEELLYESLIVGGDGGVPGGANIFPELYVSLFNAVQERKYEDAFDIHQKILEITSIVYHGDGYGSGKVISGIKSAMAVLGICKTHVAKPLQEASKSKTVNIRKLIEEI
ncbi:MAG TPA: dihydrodipicolinate synthase family protein [Balneolales bacterium]|nr:dihydrodipicolinate synthase family protein [Balneolales bacterium]